MTIFSNDTPEARTEKVLYDEIKRSMLEHADVWRQKEYIRRLNIPLDDRLDLNELPNQETLNKILNISLQYVWLKLGYNMPDRERRLIDENGNITLEL